MSKIPDEIKAGMEFLDQEVPDWRNRINLARLSMGGCVNCILGQLYGYFDDGLVELKISVHPLRDGFPSDDDFAEAARYGFSLSDFDDYEADYAQLTQAWKEALQVKNE